MQHSYICCRVNQSTPTHPKNVACSVSRTRTTRVSHFSARQRPSLKTSARCHKTPLQATQPRIFSLCLEMTRHSTWKRNAIQVCIFRNNLSNRSCSVDGKADVRSDDQAGPCSSIVLDPHHVLVGQNRKTVDAKSYDDCLGQCLKTTEFKCKSGQYYADVRSGIQ